MRDVEHWILDAKVVASMVEMDIETQQDEAPSGLVPASMRFISNHSLNQNLAGFDSTLPHYPGNAVPP